MPEPRGVEVVRAGALSTVQDLGRPGYAHLGVPHSGALDLPALRLANRLIGNEESAAGVETTLDGVALRLRRAMTVAVTGAPCAVHVRTASGAGRAVAWGEPLSLPAGVVLEVGPAESGLRSYVAVSGGVDVPPVLGSRATDLLSGLGPPPLRVGDRLPVGPARGPNPVLDQSAVRSPPADPVLRLRPGPRTDWFDDATVRALHGSSYAVGSGSNRIGLRLAGPALVRSRTGELPSEGMVLGAVQVPPDGQPVVFLADHPTTGGYPVVGVVLGADLPLCAQLRPGERVTLRVV